MVVDYFLYCLQDPVQKMNISVGKQVLDLMVFASLKTGCVMEWLTVIMHGMRMLKSMVVVSFQVKS